MKKGLRDTESLYIHDGGDEGNRTPDLLTASQALSQLSYAPVRKSTIRELPRRCKDNFGKTFRGAGAGVPRGRDGGGQCPRGRCGRAPRASGPLDARLSPRGAPRGRAAAAPPSFPAPPRTSRVPPSAAFRSRSAVRHAPGCYSTGDGPIIGADRAFAHSAISKPCRITGLDRGPPSMPELVETKPQVEGLCI